MPFTADQRALLSSVKGVGPTVIARLEQIGIDSLAELARSDTDAILAQIAGMLGSTCWRNSPMAKSAIEGAIAIARTATAR